MCDKIISDNPFSLRYVPDQYKTQKICDKLMLMFFSMPV